VPLEADTIWMDGELVPWDDANVHVLTHSFNHGTAVFEGIRCYDTAQGPMIFRLRDHVERLFASGRAILMEIPWSAPDLCAATKHVVAANGFPSSYIRMIAYRGYGEMGINPDLSPVSVAVAAWQQAPSFAEERYETGLRATISSWRRNDPNVIPPTAKIVGAYINVALARAEAVRAGFDEAIMLGIDGAVAEATIENLFVVRAGRLVTPPVSDGALPGITRDTILRLADDLSIEHEERSLARADLYAADEVFLVGTGAEVVGVREIDGRAFQVPGPVTTAAREAYADVVRGLSPRHQEWLEPVEPPAASSVTPAGPSAARRS
jgi:branched-chain amino acid aminotransferase